MLTRSMIVEWAKHNLQNNGIGPGHIATEFMKPLAGNREFSEWL